MNTNLSIIDEEFRQAAKESYLSEAEAVAMLRCRIRGELWRNRSIDLQAMMLDRMALSVGVENRKRSEAARWERRSKLLLIFLSKLRFWWSKAKNTLAMLASLA